MNTLISYALGAGGRPFESVYPDHKRAAFPEVFEEKQASPGGKEAPSGAICGTCLWQRLWQRAGVIPGAHSRAEASDG